MTDSYKKGLESDKDRFTEYFRKSVTKMEQQKFLESLLTGYDDSERQIADIACGGGTLTYHLSKIFTKSKFTLVDYLDSALEVAADINRGNNNVQFRQDDIYQLSSQPDGHFDLVFCRQTLSWLDQPEKALAQLLRIAKPGGRIFLSSLFNVDCDVDVYSKVFDLTRESGRSGVPFSYNTYSAMTFRSWLGDSGNAVFHKFVPSIDFEYSERGIGTHTVMTSDQARLQVSGGMLLNWAIVDIERK